jgi:hypothetical protein
MNDEIYAKMEGVLAMDEVDKKPNTSLQLDAYQSTVDSIGIGNILLYSITSEPIARHFRGCCNSESMGGSDDAVHIGLTGLKVPDANPDLSSSFESGELPVPVCLEKILSNSIPKPIVEPGRICGTSSSAAAESHHSPLRSILHRFGEEGSCNNTRQISINATVTVEFQDPVMFHSLRHCIMGGDSELLNSLKQSRMMQFNGGKSRSQFYATCDGKFVIKSLLPKEMDFLKKYYQGFIWYYLSSTFGQFSTLLVPILDIFSVRDVTESSCKSYILMPNVTSTRDQIVFDLKGVGSRRGRRLGNVLDTRTAQNELDDSMDDMKDCSSDFSPDDLRRERTVMWDADFRKFLNHRPLKLTTADHHRIHEGIKNDSNFLAKIGVVDYSLLFALGPNDTSKSSGSHHKGFKVGIIDYLRPFTWEKRVESVVKSFNSNLSTIKKRLSRNSYDCASTTQEDGLIPPPIMDLAPTIICPELYARRFQVNTSSLFTSQI